MAAGRLKAIVLRGQDAHATRNATAQQHQMLHVAPPRECNTQQWASYREKQVLLTRLVRGVETQHGFNPNELLDDLKQSEKGVDYWIEAFRVLAAGIPTPEPVQDDRITCSQCAMLVNGRCRAASQMPDVLPTYSPVQDVLRRCDFYKARRGDEPLAA